MSDDHAQTLDVYGEWIGSMFDRRRDDAERWVLAITIRDSIPDGPQYARQREEWRSIVVHLGNRIVEGLPARREG